MKAETIIGAFLSGGGGAKDLTLVGLKIFDPRLYIACMVGNIRGKIELVPIVMLENSATNSSFELTV
jgi:hypothetical protein